MVSLFKAAARFIKTLATGRMSSQTGTGGEPNTPNIFLFPESLFERDADKRGVDKSYRPDELLSDILGHPRAVENVGKIFVTHAYYRKVKTRAQHEFLIFKLETADGSWVNYIKVDRAPDVEPDTPPSSVKGGEQTSQEARYVQVAVSASPQFLIQIHRPQARSTIGSSFSDSSLLLSGECPARDLVRVSSSGTLKRLEKTCPDSSCLLELEITNLATPLTVEQLLMVAGVVSSYRPFYHLFHTQCYWYAHTIWALVKQIAQGAWEKDVNSGRAGRNKLLPWIQWHNNSGPESDEPKKVKERIDRHREELHGLYVEECRAFEEKLVVSRQVSLCFEVGYHSSNSHTLESKPGAPVCSTGPGAG